MKRVGLAAALLLFSQLFMQHALAADQTAAALDAPNERRSGLVLGMGGGFGIAGSSGYPNNATKIGDSSVYSSSGVMGGSGGSFFLMGALADYVNFGVFFGGGSYQSSTFRSTGGGVGFRIEVFPLYRAMPTLADWAVYTQLGVGATTLHTKLPGAYPDADGAQSLLGLGTFYEWSLGKALGGHFATGPLLEYDVITSRSIERHSGLVGGRFAFYGGK